MKKTGFSLIEVMMVLAIMGVAAVGFMTFMRNQNKTQKTIISSGEINILVNEVRGHLAKEEICVKSFKGFRITKDKPVPVEKILKFNDEVMYEIGKIYGDANVTLSSMSLVDFDTDSKDGLSGRLKLKLALERNAEVYGNKTINRTINLDVMLDEGELLVDCYPAGMQRAIDNSSKIKELQQMQEAVMQLMEKSQKGDSGVVPKKEESRSNQKEVESSDRPAQKEEYREAIPQLPDNLQITEEQMQQGLELLKQMMEKMQQGE